MKLDDFHPLLVVIMAFLVSAKCAAALPSPQPVLRDPAPGEGTVIGSVWIKGGKDLLGRTRYAIGINRADKKNTFAHDYIVEARRGGDEEVFAFVMPGGEYRISQLKQLGFSNFGRSMSLVFNVEPGKTTYVGRLLVEFPQETITIYTPVRFSVEDAGAATVPAAQVKFDKEFEGASAQLMAATSTDPSALPGKTTADPRLEQDTLFVIMGMDSAEDQGCKQRALANREIVKADSDRALEHWTINRCGTSVRYAITFSPRPGGGTLVHYTRPEVIGKAQP